MQTVVVISVKPWGVVQFGSKKKVRIIEMPEIYSCFILRGLYLTFKAEAKES